MKIEKIDENSKKEKVKKIDENVTPITQTTVFTEPVDNSWEINSLPSRGVLYPEGTVITAKPLKLVDLKMLSGAGEDNINYVTTTILRKSISGIRVEDLVSADKLYILFWIRAQTFTDSGFHVEFPCTKCKTESEYHFELANLETKELPEDYNPDKVLELPISKDNVSFRFARVKDESFLEAFRDKNKKNVNMYMNDELLQSCLAIKTVNEGKLTIEGRYKYISNLDPRDFSVVETYLKSIDIGIIPVLNVTCLKCGGTSPAGLTFRSDFFIPQYKS